MVPDKIVSGTHSRLVALLLIRILISVSFELVTMVAPSAPAHRVGGNLMLASLLAHLSYVPFEWVAKGTLILCVLLFIVDPFPPVSRLVSLLATLIVALLSKTHRQWHQDMQDEEEEKESESDQQNDASTSSSTVEQVKDKST